MKLMISNRSTNHLHRAGSYSNFEELPTKVKWFSRITVHSFPLAMSKHMSIISIAIKIALHNHLNRRVLDFGCIFRNGRSQNINYVNKTKFILKSAHIFLILSSPTCPLMNILNSEMNKIN